ncbi:CDP-diacylglycerol--serine O-phosphatidyltransferase [Cetobacterium sp. SF1]|uniref:CDP-diacylglycerol--serine O-phosphatidyltransferase n=1 Tax=unclassified Cetobacterium TaxID=2630983 RepID=UPI003CE9A6DF
MVEKKYIAPNAITAANMFLGYLSITASISGDFTKAVWFVILAMVCDGLDGKTARKLDAFSEFGKEFDSFCDAISFGLAPAILVYSILRSNLEASPFILPVSFIYALCGVMRLVKFNIVTVASSEKDDFSGMPIPSGASIVCGYYMICHYLNANFGINIFSIELFMGITVIAAVLMVSTIPFQTPDKSFKFIPKKMMIPFVIFIIATLKYSLFIFTCFYVLKNVGKFFSGRFQGNN